MPGFLVHVSALLADVNNTSINSFMFITMNEFTYSLLHLEIA